MLDALVPDDCHLEFVFSSIEKKNRIRKGNLNRLWIVLLIGNILRFVMIFSFAHSVAQTQRYQQCKHFDTGNGSNDCQNWKEIVMQSFNQRVNASLLKENKFMLVNAELISIDLYWFYLFKNGWMCCGTDL